MGLGFLQQGWNEGRIKEINRILENDTPERILSWTVDWVYPWISFACSFGLEDVVILHFLSKLEKKPKIFFIDTGRIHQETYEVIDRIKNKYGLEIDVYFPEGRDVARMSSLHGYNHIYESHENRKECCEVRKLVPLRKALTDARGWITGLRREQNLTRKQTDILEIDHANGGILKVNPLAQWSLDDVWQFIKANDVPYNSLHDQGFPSIGCVPCTRAVEGGEDIRSGRWWWENPEKKECGLHRVKATREAEETNG